MRRILVALSSVTILATACGGGSSSPLVAPATTSSAAVSTTSVQIQGNSADGAPAVSYGSSEIPPGFPMPVPDWAEVFSVRQYDSGDGASFTIQLSVDSSRKDEIMDIYRGLYSDQGMTIVDQGDFISGQNAELFSAAIASVLGDETLVILSWGPS